MPINNNAFLLRNYGREHGEGPGDKIIILAKGTQTGHALTVALKGIVKKGATVSYCVMKQIVTDATDAHIDTDADVADGVAVDVLIYCDANDLADAGD